MASYLYEYLPKEGAECCYLRQLFENSLRRRTCSPLVFVDIYKIIDQVH